jgi:hypothetical protein
MRFDKYAAELRLAKRAARHECPLSRFWMTANENDNGLERVKSTHCEMAECGPRAVMQSRSVISAKQRVGETLQTKLARWRLPFAPPRHEQALASHPVDGEHHRRPGRAGRIGGADDEVLRV